MDDGATRSNNRRNLLIKTNQFVVGHLNISSFNTGFDEFGNYLNDLNVDVMGVSGTWLTPIQKTCIFKISGCNFIHNVREVRGGGIRIL